MSGPTHLDADGAPHMVDVGAKPVTARRALAGAVVRMRPDVLAVLLDAGGPKGDAIVTARLAGIAAAKRTPDLIPLCHPLPIDAVDIEIEPDREAGIVAIRAEVRVTARTGAEMEALTVASVAALTLYDMAKALQRDIVIEDVRLLAKSGGRSGTYPREPVDAAEHEAVVVVCSNRSAAGEREDASGPMLVGRLRAAGFDVVPDAIVVADDEGAIAGLSSPPGAPGSRRPT
jgi:cyclic pyranopterin phosphate synthase